MDSVRAVLLLIGGNVLLLAASRMVDGAPASAPPSDNEPSCLKVSDFYSVHLTTFFLAAAKTAGRQKTKQSDTCPIVTGSRNRAGNFTIDLMEQDARDLGVAIRSRNNDSKGQLALLKEVPRHPSGRGAHIGCTDRGAGQYCSSWRSAMPRARTTPSNAIGGPVKVCG